MDKYVVNNEELNKLKNDENYSKIMSRSINELELKKAEQVYKYLIKFCEENNLVKANSWFNYYLGWVNYDLLSLEESIKYHKNAIKGFECINENNGIVLSINGLFADYIKQQKFERAMELAIKGITFAERDKNYEAIGVIKTNMLGVYAEIGEYEKAIELYDDIERLGYIVSKENQVINAVNRCICEFGLGNKESAIKYGEKAYIIAKENNYDNLTPNVLSELANIYIDIGEFDIAIEKLNEGKEYIKDNVNNLGSIAILISLADLEVKRKNYKIAIERFKEVEEILLEKDYKNELRDVYSRISVAYKEMEDYKKSIKYLEKHIDLDKNLQRELKIEKIKQLNEIKEEEENKTYKSLYNQTENIYKFGQKITSNLEKENILNILANEVNNLIDYDIFQIVLYKEDESLFEVLLCIEEGNRVEIEPFSINEESFNGYCVKNNKEILMNDINNEFYRYVNINSTNENKIKVPTNNKICNSAMFVPLNISDKPIGVISIQSYEKGKYNLKDLNTLKIISSFIAIALENSKLYKEVRYFAKYDYLTKVLNKGQALKEGKEIYDIMLNNNESLAIMMMDIDNFKIINDTYGHQFGDIVIQHIANIIKKSVRKNDVVGRYGGEEFIVFFNGNSQEEYISISERIRYNIENSPIKNNDGELIKVTCSIGVVYKDVIKGSLNDLINSADMALYKAKKTGKNKVVISN